MPRWVTGRAGDVAESEELVTELIPVLASVD
jgi:hypothetical protein